MSDALGNYVSENLSDLRNFMSADTYTSTNAEGTVWESFVPADTRRFAQHIVTTWTDAAGY